MGKFKKKMETTIMGIYRFGVGVIIGTLEKENRSYRDYRDSIESKPKAES